jgi:hypothetical protein
MRNKLFVVPITVFHHMCSTISVQFNPVDVMAMRKAPVPAPQASKVSMEDMNHIYALVVELLNPEKRESALLELR